MQSSLRLMLFGFCGVCGIAAAVGFAIWSEPTDRQLAKQPLAPTPEPQSPETPKHADTAVDTPVEQATAPPTEEQGNLQEEDVAEVADTSSDVTLQPPAELDATFDPPERLASGGLDALTLGDSNGHPLLQGPAAWPLVQQQPALVVPAAPLVAQQASEADAPASNALPIDNLGKALDILSSALSGKSNKPADASDPQAAPQKALPPPPPPVEPGLQASDSDRAAGGPQATLDENGRFQLNTKPDADLREVLELLSQKSGLNILASNSVQGTVTASLNNVDTMTALDAILKSTGYVAYREGEIIFVGTAEEYRQRKHRVQNIETRIYRPNYITATEFQQLVTPLLSPEVGAISISSASAVGIESDNTQAGGDDFTGNEVVLVRDYENVLLHVDRVFHEVDCQPDQVSIEAMILSVTLSDQTEIGVDFELLKDQANVRLISGSPPTSLGAIVADGGLKVGFLDSSTTVFIEALETIGDTNVIASPRLLVLNKQRAEILIGSELGYVSTTVTETAVTQAVEFLEVGTQLRIRPFIAKDGMVRMEVHPELSTGAVRVEGGFTLPDKEVTEVTTNIMAKDGSTVVIGGLIREDLGNTVTQIPFLGSLPVVGPAFRQITETTDRREIIVLITPRILHNKYLDREGHESAAEFHHRQAHVAETFSPLSRLSLSDRHLHTARVAWSNGNQRRALHQVNLALHFNPQSREALDLRSDIVEGAPFPAHGIDGPYVPETPHYLDPLNQPQVPPWLLDELEGGYGVPPGEPVPRGHEQQGVLINGR
ncbi:MAG: hypothetical protein DWQ31_14415 [Planctomycetota bacterium]|nr:MAG: hypothetical protein DWQ31_14415 [Planctomycetota bacterium]REJ94560.1 MAG: hypothetical protein DWQ35_08120 [Planctomycetota bacterium]REK18577.1 MAG: hypothetical protein DWQ42_19350 [Planctomycetota bacterium]REK37472.1 MAG: hypothetical protein DWQ46_21825 [Planctomycetota bacterium]